MTLQCIAFLNVTPFILAVMDQANRLCRTAVKLEAACLTRVYRITQFDRAISFFMFERSQNLKQIKIKQNSIYSKREKK
jgi:predicted GNAT superfamily acetyltransferase